jgi:CheY-like chemotaxis protein
MGEKFTMNTRIKKAAKSEQCFNKEYSFFERCIEILVVDDDPCILDLHEECLARHKMYNISKASCAKEANEIFLSERRIHVCLLDLGIADMDRDEYYLLKKFSTKTSFIVVTGRDSLEEGFKARNLGAYAAIKKPIKFEEPSFIHNINDAFLQTTFKKIAGENDKSVVVDAVNILMTDKPADMKIWTEMLNVDEGYLRKIWKRYFDCQPRHMLILFNAFLKAFEYYNNVYWKEIGLMNNAEEDFENKFEYVNNQFKTICQKHQKEIDAIIFGKRCSISKEI